MKKIAIIAGMGLMSLTAAHAQQDSTLNRTVVVENQYNPTVMDASKINVLPKVEEPVVPKMHIDYATSLRPVSAWSHQTMAPIVREAGKDTAYRGYLRAGYGNNGNVDAQLGYLWDISKKDRLNVEASFDGWNGELKGAEHSNGDWTSRLYNTQVGLDYKHSFKKVDFLLGGGYRSQVFNYMPFYSPNPYAVRSGATRQHQTLANGYVGFASTDKDMAIQFAGELGIHYLNLKYPTYYLEDGNEINLYAKADVWKMLGDETRAGLQVKFDNYSYSSDKVEGAMGLDLNPYYAVANDDWRVRLGANIDWWSGVYDMEYGKKGKVYFSPDVLVEHIFSDSYVLYAKAGGGRKTNSFYQLTCEYSPYWMNRELVPTYVTLDVALGLKASPVDGLWFNLSGGYKITENDFIPYGFSVGGASYFAGVSDCKTQTLYGTAELKYDYKDVWNVFVKGTYYNWDGEGPYISVAPGYEAGDMYGLLPEFEVSVGAGVKVFQGFRLNLGYDFVKRHDPNEYNPINNLYAGADYTILKNVGLFAKVNNILNQEYVRYDAYPAQGLNFLGGLSLRF